MAEAIINSGILQWAARRAEADADLLARKMNVSDASRVQDWLNGQTRPTFLQAKKLAGILHVPFGYLFLDAPPSDPLPVPDLRTVGDSVVSIASPELRDVVTDVMFKMDWYKEHLRETGVPPVPFVGAFSMKSPTQKVASDITRTLSLAIADRSGCRDAEAFRGVLIERCEAAGVWVLCSGIVGGNTHRALDVEDFRGFAIAEPLCPVVFLNGKDAKSAQVFTLMHELAHLWIGESGISDLAPGAHYRGDYLRVEKKCNKIAAEVLVPETSVVERLGDGDDVSDYDFLRQEAAFYKVSPVMYARRCVDLDFLDWQEFSAFYRQERHSWNPRASSGGGDFYRNVPVRNGKRFTRAVLESAVGGGLLLRDAGRLLDVNPARLDALAERQGL